jgi:hypothetical protein
MRGYGFAETLGVRLEVATCGRERGVAEDVSQFDDIDAGLDGLRCNGMPKRLGQCSFWDRGGQSGALVDLLDQVLDASVG